MSCYRAAPAFEARGNMPKNRHRLHAALHILVEMTRCKITDADVHYPYWAEAVNTTNFLQNMLPTKPSKLTPFETWYGRKSDFSMRQVFDTEAYVFVPKRKRAKHESKTVKMIFVWVIHCNIRRGILSTWIPTRFLSAMMRDFFRREKLLVSP